MRKIVFLIKNIYWFFEFLFALLCLKKENEQVTNKKNVLITPIRGLDNTWIDYLLAIKFSKMHNIKVFMIRPSSLPFNESEKYGLYSTKLMLAWYEIKYLLLFIVLKLRGIQILGLDKNSTITKLDPEIEKIIETTKDEFLRRYFGNRNYKDNPLFLQIKSKVNSTFYNFYKSLELEIQNIDLLWTSHAIYEWKLPYNLSKKYNKKISVWGRSVYNTDLICVSNGPLQIMPPKGYLHTESRLDMEKRIGGGAIDQPTVFDNSLNEKIEEFFDRNKNIVLLTPNCIWDGDISDRDSLFESLYEWVNYTLSLAKVNKDLAVVVRFHPSEATLWKNRPGLWQIFESMELESNQLLISPSSKVSTIELAKKSDKVVFYSGILSLECLYLNIKPFCVSNSFYKHVKGVCEIKTKSEYEELLKTDNIDNYKSSGMILPDDLFCYGLKIIGKNETLRSNPKFRSYAQQVEIEKYFLELIDDNK